jgi:hypothetical protein
MDEEWCHDSELLTPFLCGFCSQLFRPEFHVIITNYKKALLETVMKGTVTRRKFLATNHRVFSKRNTSSDIVTEKKIRFLFSKKLVFEVSLVLKFETATRS